MKRILIMTMALLALPSLAIAQPALIGTVAADGKTTATSATNPVPILGTVTTDDQKGAGATTATTLRTVTAIDSPDVTSLGTVAGAVSGARVQTSPVVGQAGVAAGAGAAGATTQRVVLATDDPAVTALGAVSGTPAAAPPTKAIQVAGSDGAALRPLAVDTGGTAWINLHRVGGALADVNAGVVGAGTQRVTLATDDAAVTSLGTLDDAVGAPAAAIPSKGVLLLGNNGGTALALTSNTGGKLQIDATHWGGAATAGSTGDVTAGTARVVEAAVSSGTSTHVAVDASEVAVLAAKAGRKYLRIQVYADTDGSVCCALGATTSACAIGEILDPSPAADRGGGSLDFSGYSGAVTCRATGAWTTTVAATEY